MWGGKECEAEAVRCKEEGKKSQAYQRRRMINEGGME